MSYQQFHYEYNKIIAKRMKLEVKNAKKSIRLAIKEATDEILREFEGINDASYSDDWYNDGASSLHKLWFQDFIKEQTQYSHPIIIYVDEGVLVSRIDYSDADLEDGYNFPKVSFAQILVEAVLRHGEEEESGRIELLEAIYALPDLVDALLDKERPNDMDKVYTHRLDTLEEAREAERNKIADWFLKNNLRQLADDIRAKEHYK